MQKRCNCALKRGKNSMREQEPTGLSEQEGDAEEKE